ncbi:uncharacterized protein LOC105444582 [Strongylocentrotus purpuratus]|uniref:Uncharacterized protein n=1 Tax=Strongylocentrotus purpuratus TaxID=7668 RepID=A0A7M7HL36_STRPU|nr:uncharacterized protein LOC105444582 [Strongylocentrotus purpuratus]
MDTRNWKALFMVISIGVSSAKEPVHVGQCYILKDNPEAIATPSYRNQTVSSNGCVGDSDSNIHVLAMTYEPPELSKFGFSDDRLRPNVTVHVTSHLGQQEKRPTVLVVASATPVQLTVIIDRGVNLETILWSSMLLYSGMSILIEPDDVHRKRPIFVELLPDSIANIGDGSPFDPLSDDRNHTAEFLDYVRKRYGYEVASFTGTNKKVDAWLLTINGGPNIEVKKDISEDRIRNESSGNGESRIRDVSSKFTLVKVKNMFVSIDKTDNLKLWMLLLNVAAILLFLSSKRKK